MTLYKEWLAYAKLHPLTFDEKYRQSRADWNAGLVASTFWNALTAVFSRWKTNKKPGDMMFRERPRLVRQRSASDLFQDLKSILSPLLAKKDNANS